MILNAHTDPCGTRPRVKHRPERSVKPCLRVDEQGVRLDPNGSLDERCAWMRERQRERREKENRDRAFRRLERRRGKQDPPESNVA